MKRIVSALLAVFIFFQCRAAVSSPQVGNTSTVALLPSNLPISISNPNHISTEETDGQYHFALPVEEQPLASSIEKGVMGGNLDHLKRVINSNIPPAHAPDYYLISTVPMQSTNNVQYFTVSQLANICFNKYFVDVYVVPQVMTMVPQSIKNMLPGNTINF